MEDMQKNPSPMAKHFLEHPSFSSEDIGMGQGTEVARKEQRQKHTKSLDLVKLAKTALTEHVSAELVEKGADHKKPRREDAPEPTVAVLSAVEVIERRTAKNRAKKANKKERMLEARALIEAANRMDEVALAEAKAATEEDSEKAASKKANV